MTCPEIEIILSAQMEGEATASQWREAEQHLASCRACAELWQNFQASTALFKTKLVRHEPAAALWEKISGRIEATPRQSWWERVQEQWDDVLNAMQRPAPRVVLGLGLAAMLLLLFSLPQWRAHTSTQATHAPVVDSAAVAFIKPKQSRIELSENDPLLRARLAQNVSNYLEATRLVLLEVKNNALEPEALDVTEIKQSSQKLLEQTLLLKTEMKDEQHKILHDTLEQLELVLFDLANLEEKPAQEEMETLRAAIQQGDLLIKVEIIDLEAMARKEQKQPALPPNRRSKKLRI